MLVKAAFGISKKWGIGVFLPFGPLFFRISFPEEARRARWVQLATLPCLFAYVMISPELIPDTRVALVRVGPAGQQQYAVVAGGRTFRFGRGHGQPAASETTAEHQPSLEERRQANEREFARLAQVGEELRFRKRDLLNADRDGAAAYNRSATEYNLALQKATAEKMTLADSANQTASR